MELTRVVVDCINCLLEMWIAVFFFSAFRPKRVSRYALVAIVSCVGLVYAFVIMFMGSASGIWFIGLGLTYIIALCYQFKWYNAVWISVIISLLSSLSEMVLVMLLTLSGMSLEATQANIYTYIIGILLSKSITCLVIVVIHKGRHHLFQSARGNNFLGIMLLPVASSLIILVFLNYCLQYTISNMWKVLSIFALVMLIVANVTIFYIIDKQYELISARQKLKMSEVLLESQRKYYDHVFESQQEIRRMRHDLKHSFIGVLANIDSGNIEEARKMVQSQLSDTERSMDLSSRKTDNLMNSVIYSKKEAAVEKSILLHSDVVIREKIGMDDLDLAVLLGNLLDNALEAAAKMEEAQRKIDLMVRVERGTMMISCKNPVAEDIDVKHIETMKSDKKNHGFGLLSIKSIVEKYDGIYTISCKNNLFSFSAQLPNNA